MTFFIEGSGKHQLALIATQAQGASPRCCDDHAAGPTHAFALMRLPVCEAATYGDTHCQVLTRTDVGPSPELARSQPR